MLTEVSFAAPRLSEFIDDYGELIGDIELRSMVDTNVFEICSGYVIDFLKCIDFNEYEQVGEPANWTARATPPKRYARSAALTSEHGVVNRYVRFIYAEGNGRKILSIRVKLDKSFTDWFFSFLRTLYDVRRRTSDLKDFQLWAETACTKDIFDANRTFRTVYTNSADFASKQALYGGAKLSRGEYETWIAWSKWMMQLYRAGLGKELGFLVGDVFKGA